MHREKVLIQNAVIVLFFCYPGILCNNNMAFLHLIRLTLTKWHFFGGDILEDRIYRWTQQPLHLISIFAKTFFRTLFFFLQTYVLWTQVPFESGFSQGFFLMSSPADFPHHFHLCVTHQRSWSISGFLCNNVYFCKKLYTNKLELNGTEFAICRTYMSKV